MRTQRCWALVLAVAAVGLPARIRASELAVVSPVRMASEPPGAPVDEDLQFDLLGDAPPVAPVDSAAVELRRTLLNLHQVLGIGLLLATAGLCVVGQLSYDDLYHGGGTGRFEPTHAYLAYGSMGLFTITGAAAIVTPLPFERKSQGFDRTLAHKIALVTAGAAMAGGAILGSYSASRVGRLDQQSYTRVHLAVSYSALASMAVGVAVLVF